MKKTRFTEEQMVAILREADVKAVAKKHGISAQTIYAWRTHFGTLEPADVNVSGNSATRARKRPAHRIRAAEHGTVPRRPARYDRHRREISVQ